MAGADSGADWSDQGKRFGRYAFYTRFTPVRGWHVLASRARPTTIVLNHQFVMNDFTCRAESPESRTWFTSAGLIDVVRDLYQYWTPGRPVPTPEDLVPAEEPAAAGAAPAAGGDGPSISAAASRVPAAILERSAAALLKWKANH